MFFVSDIVLREACVALVRNFGFIFSDSLFSTKPRGFEVEAVREEIAIESGLECREPEDWLIEFSILAELVARSNPAAISFPDLCWERRNQEIDVCFHFVLLPIPSCSSA